VKRTEIAVLGAPPTGGLRLELNGSPGEDGLALDFLHDQRQTGTLARVVGGRIGLGEVVVPVAVKLQRDVALSQEDRGSVAAKFDKERNVHRRLQDAGQAGDGPERIVRQLEVWAGPSDREADSLEPCILCARARHGLAPRCPECRDAHAVLEELELTDDRGLRCPRCQRQFWSTPKTRDAILDATLRRDAACRGCPNEHNATPDGCRPTAVFLNFFRNRLLLFERLDLDLDDYLRWQRDPAAAGPRRAARRAFEEHRRRLEERRASLPGPSVAKTADLLRVADLFADILTGVEHLHRHGIAHLDLKPANVCLRFQGADLDVKVIDLGLSDDPHTLTYLRQAEGPLSLWTDYSAPEFRRPRTRPLAVEGRFIEGACELSWPAPETPAQDVPLPGDLGFFEDRELGRRPFRVVHVCPGHEGRLLVQARAEPRHRLWQGEAVPLPAFGPEAVSRGALTAVLEKHCGFPADVHSLGMLLLALLAGHPEVGDFREALPGVQIELEELCREQPLLPARALVHQLLGRPSKHLHVFRSYAHRLSAFGLARPLAEELLGVVLRAALRGDGPVLYVADRGADARPGLRRLRADLEAVRAALRATLATAHAGAVRETRLAVLDQFRGRVHGCVADAGPPPRRHPDGRLLYPALDLGAAGEDYRHSELAYFPPSSAPVSVLDRWEKELAGQAGDRSAVRSWDFVVYYCRRFETDPAVAARIVERYHEIAARAREVATAVGPAAAEDRERLLAWVDASQALAERLECGPRFLDHLRTFLAALKDRLVTPWDRALRARRVLLFRRRAARVPLSRAERAAIPDTTLEAALQELCEAVDKGITARRQRGQDFERALARWRTWCAGRSWLGAVGDLEAAALEQYHKVEALGRVWDQEWSRALVRLHDSLGQVRAALRAYDARFGEEHDVEEIVVRLTRQQREAIDLKAVDEAAGWLRHNWPAPGERLEALFALWELGTPAGETPALS
jgi:hypothetical protein